MKMDTVDTPDLAAPRLINNGSQSRQEVTWFPSRFGFGFKVVVLIVATVMMLAELTQARKNWLEGNVAKESERLVRIQQEREKADIEVALSAARKNIQEEMRAIAEREASVMLAIKHVQEGWGSPLMEAAGENMFRFKKAYAVAKSQEQECRRTNLCSEADLLRHQEEQRVYDMLFYSSRGALYHFIDRKSVKAKLEIE
jgi:hypothetical protein